VKKIAITGGIATGKTTLLNILKDLGFKTFSCDQVVKKLYQREDVQKRAKELLGEDVFSLTKPDLLKILKLITEDDAKRKKLEEILHPLVKAELNRFLKECEEKGEKVVFVEVPLLFEVNWDKEFDEVWVVWCSEATQEKRILERGETAPYLLKLKTKQIPIEKKAKLAHKTFSSEKPISTLKKEVLNALKN